MDQKTIAELDKELDPRRVRTMKVPGRPDAPYLQSYDVINAANRIFGYGNWGVLVTNQEIKQVGEKTICIAKVFLRVQGAHDHEDVGAVVAAQARGQPLTPEALETALKGAVSDGMKRCLRHYGNQFGNSLYSKEKPTRRQQPDPGQIAGVPDIDEREAAPDAETLRSWIHRRVEGKGWDDDRIPSEKQLGLLNGLLSNIFGKDEMAERQRHQFLDYVFGILTSKELTLAQASVLIDWAKDPVTLKALPVAVAEGQMVVQAHEVDGIEIPF